MNKKATFTFPAAILEAFTQVVELDSWHESVQEALEHHMRFEIESYLDKVESGQYATPTDKKYRARISVAFSKVFAGHNQKRARKWPFNDKDYPGSWRAAVERAEAEGKRYGEENAEALALMDSHFARDMAL